MEQVLKLKESGTILGLRELAKQLSFHVRNAVINKSAIILDFSDVETISSSFADELIAKIFVEVGSEDFLNNVKIRNANKFIKTIINSSINDRVQEQNG